VWAGHTSAGSPGSAGNAVRRRYVLMTGDEVGGESDDGDHDARAVGVTRRDTAVTAASPPRTTRRGMRSGSRTAVASTAEQASE
jgi:hypothetical protein